MPNSTIKENRHHHVDTRLSGGINTPASQGRSIQENRFHHVDTSRSGGRNISEAWQLLFSQNEANPNSLKLTDEEISQTLIRMFPSHAPSANLRPIAVRRNRRLYNRGALPGQPSPPLVPSRRYLRSAGPNGKTRLVVLDSRGRLLEEIKP